VTTNADQWGGYPISGMGKWVNSQVAVPSEPGWYVSVFMAESKGVPDRWRMRWWDGQCFSIGASRFFTASEATATSRYKCSASLMHSGIHWRKLVA
jgi:hypothetical protein